MPESSGCPKRPVLIDIESGFSLSAGRFMTTKGNVVRANGSRLRALFNPTSLRLRQDQEKAERAAEVLSNKVFVAGQLKHYGIKFPRTAKLGFIRDILRRAVEQGKCDQVPPFVRRVEEVLRRDIAPLDEEWETKAQVWQENSFAVRKLAETIGETNRKDEDHQRDNDREHDTDYEPCGPAPDQNLANASQPLDLEWLFGSYVIQFEGITEDWHMTDVFTLDIGELNDGVLMAAYDFGDVWGTMILSQL
ncbi:hypothetical protein CEP52_005629 [Fusarium oligoseptatum]|uniref:Uncharacterized protein n=1 Tax=Fusarium oligoseptatum TaxID=2604345 RepID=A0A428TXG6_9HYPO|nr:hypothetical protein CEP52_005629 [Fusarium oligoseptatum]